MQDIEQIRTEMNTCYERYKELSETLFGAELESKGYFKTTEAELYELLKKGDIYRINDLTNFVLLRNNKIFEVSVFSENEWTQIQIRRFIFDKGTYIKKVQDTDLIKFLSSIKQSDFKELI